ncbi:MAG: enoyl-CoA hydratase-related protein [Acidobacteriota bacterium]|nr:enoyl-CoA hydratase-related protein [Blastocatellia bacterium]MDW8411232.1 enoyl-CoA hydratase-related protein [Acidobacteriota bacterium]
MSYSKILYSSHENIVRIVLNRPEKRNALDDVMIAEIKAALRAAAAEPTSRVIAIEGAGKDFCSGADLSVLQKVAKGSILENLHDTGLLMELFLLIRNLPLPVVALVRGKALAGGCGLATACDIILASDTAQFGYPEVKIGFIPAMVMAILRRSVSEKRAFELITLGEPITAKEAASIGLINKVYKEEDFEEKVDEFLKTLASRSQSAVFLSKRLLYQMDGMTYETALKSGMDANTICRMTEDCKAGISHFLKK